jgi:hypothetical protein
VKCFSLFVGSRNSAAASRRFTRRDDEVIRTITFRHFPGGFTVLNADGGWFDPQQKRYVAEESRQIYVCAKNKRGLRPWHEEIRRALHQHELLLIELGAAHYVRGGNAPEVRANPHPKSVRRRPRGQVHRRGRD